MNKKDVPRVPSSEELTNEPVASSSSVARRVPSLQSLLLYSIPKSKQTLSTQSLRGIGFDVVIDEILSSMGEFGRYQMFLFLLVLPFTAALAGNYFAQLFIIVTPRVYWCKIPELDVITDPKLRRELATPKKDGKWLNCYTYETDWTQVAQTQKPPDEDTEIIPCGFDFEFEFEDIPYATVVTERQWVCDNAHIVPLSQTVFFIGAILGGCLIGYLADKLGRKPALVVANALAFTGGMLTIYTTGVLDFLICRLIAGMGFDNLYFVLYVVLLEYVGASYRTFAANMGNAVFYSTFCMSLPVLAYVISDWRLFVFVTTLPTVTATIVPFVVPESARWLVTKGRVDEALKIFRKFERVNRKKIPDKLMEKFTASAGNLSKHESYREVVRSKPVSIALCLIVLIYSFGALVYDCIMRLSGQFEDSFFTSFALYAFTEMPSNMFNTFFMDKFGRRKISFSALLLSALVAIIGAFLPPGTGVVVMTMLCRMGVIVSFYTLTQWATEVLPTPVRASGSSIVHITGFIASMLSPILAFDNDWHGGPLLKITVICLVGAVVSLLPPETVGLLLPQSVADSERIVKMYSYLYTRRKNTTPPLPPIPESTSESPTPSEARDV